MRSRGGRSDLAPSQRNTTTRSWAVEKTDQNAPYEWLRRSYTRTIPKDLRTVEQLRLSFEDVCQQWQTSCEQFGSHFASATAATDTGAATEPYSLPPGLRSAVERIVSQLKAIKQELLAQVTRLLDGLATPQHVSASTPSPSSKSDGLRQDESWLQDLIGAQNEDAACLSAAAKQASQARRTEYLVAVWLARRVWAWSICLACATMDLELLSGSIGLSTQLFFGCPFSLFDGESREQRLHAPRECVLHSCYDKDGAITEDELLAAASASHRDGAASALSTLREEACEMRAFFAFHSSTPRRGAFEAADAKVGSAGEPSAPQERIFARHLGTARSDTPVLQDAFWVHAIALCYSAMSSDDVSAARLLTLFHTAQNVYASHDAEDDEKETANSNTIDTVEDSQLERQRAIAVVRQAAELLLVEDFNAVQCLWQRGGYLVGGATSPSLVEGAPTHPNGQGSEANAPSPSPSPLAAACPEGCLLVLLVRLLSEHVVRRRWTEQNVGQAFRPVQPVPHTEPSGKGKNNENPNRLLCALSLSSREVDAQDAAAATGNARGVVRENCAWRLCSALQMAALREMGGDWPIPGPLLKGAFGGV